MIPPLTDSDPEWHTDLRKAAEMALPLLVAYQDYTGDSRIANECGELIEALRTALAQPEPQVCCGDYEKCMKACTPRGRWLVERELAQPEQEPVAWLEYDDKGYLFLSGKRKGAFPVFIAPPSKPWVSLTDREIEKAIVSTTPSFKPDDVAQAIEAALRSKNNG